MADTPQAHTSAEAGATHSEPELLGLVPFQWVSLAMAVLLLIAFVGAKVHKTIAAGLDARIAEIRQQLEEAKALRAEAEALRDEYAAKIASAEADAGRLMDSATEEADAILAKAEADSAEMVKRRQRMAEEKIAAAERAAIADVKARAVTAAAVASRKLIAERHDQKADKTLADEVIASL